MSVFTAIVNTATYASENIVATTLNNLRYGSLTVCTPTSTYIFPAPSSDAALVSNESDEPRATIHVRNPNFFLRVLLSGDLGFAEAYMFGEIDLSSEDLFQIFLIYLKNKEVFSNLECSPLAQLLELPKRALTLAVSPLTRLARFTAIGVTRVLTDARMDVSAHYDLGNEMFQAFLSRDMMYSRAIFPSLDADVYQSKDGEEELHDAQIRKLEHIIRKADIRPGHRVLEIGSGWGSLSLMITQSIPGTVVDTLTLSTQQAAHIHARIKQLCDAEKNRKDHDVSLKERLRVHLMDYRSMPPEWKDTFDRVVSVEMVEAVSREYLEGYCASIDWALKKDAGVAVVQAITIPEGRYDGYIKREEFIQKWVIFPGTTVHTLTALMNAMSKGSQDRLVVDSISSIGPHYARTLREWWRRFEAGFGEGNPIEEALKKEHPETMTGPGGKEAIEVFRRKFIYYFVYTEAGFSTRVIGDHIITFCREAYQDYACQTCE